MFAGRCANKVGVCALACVAITMTACDIITPDGDNARGFAYVLESADGDPLPVDMPWVLDLTPYEPFTVAADTLWFGGPNFLIGRHDVSGAPVAGFWGVHFADGDSLGLYSTGAVGFEGDRPPEPPDVAAAVRNGRLTLASLANPATLPVPGRALVYRRVNSPEPREELAGTFVLETVDGGAIPDSVPRSPTSTTNVAFVAETLTVSIDRGLLRWVVTDPETLFSYPRPGIVTTTRDSIFLRQPRFGLGEPFGGTTAPGTVRRDGIEVRAPITWSLAGRLLWYRRVSSN